MAADRKARPRTFCSKCGTKTTAKERQAQFQKETLFCTVCNVILDHTRKSSVASHLDATKHKARKELGEKSSQPVKRQQVLTESHSVSSTVSTVASQGKFFCLFFFTFGKA